MPKGLHAFDYLAKPQKHPAATVCVVYGDEAFLKKLCCDALRSEVLGDEEDEFSLTKLIGKETELRDVLDEISTRGMFGSGRRMVLVQEADDFVSKYRQGLEDFVKQTVDKPTGGGVLLLDVKTWASNTRLYKAVDKSGLQIECKVPSRGRQLAKWLVQRATEKHQCQLQPAAAETLIEMIGPELGLLDGELAKLALTTDAQQPITSEIIQDAVGGWRAKTTWEMLDVALAGNAREALIQLDRLLLSGENPISLFAQIASNLRRLAAATRVVKQTESAGRRPSISQALTHAGTKPFILKKAEGQLRQLGRERGSQLYRWLIDADLALKGSSSSPPLARLVLEKLIVRLSSQLAPKKPARAVRV